MVLWLPGQRGPATDGLAAYIFIGSARHEFGRLCAPTRRQHERSL
jgi:hypothetical protein